MNAWIKTIAFLAALASVGGCSGWQAQSAFRRIRVNQTTQAQASERLPKSTITTTVSLVYLNQNKTPAFQEVVLCLLDTQGLITGKLALQSRQEHWGLLKKTVATFDAEIAPPPGFSTSDGGPVDQLRLVFEKLRKKQYDYNADQAHRLVCAAILRTLEALPDVSPAASDRQPFTDALEWFPPNGAVTIKTTDHQTYRFTYKAESSAVVQMTFGSQP